MMNSKVVNKPRQYMIKANWKIEDLVKKIEEELENIHNKKEEIHLGNKLDSK